LYQNSQQTATLASNINDDMTKKEKIALAVTLSLVLLNLLVGTFILAKIIGGFKH
jgi:hypothetical protein